MIYVNVHIYIYIYILYIHIICAYLYIYKQHKCIKTMKKRAYMQYICINNTRVNINNNYTLL